LLASLVSYERRLRLTWSPAQPLRGGWCSRSRLKRLATFRSLAVAMPRGRYVPKRGWDFPYAWYQSPAGVSALAALSSWQKWPRWSSRLRNLEEYTSAARQLYLLRQSTRWELATTQSGCKWNVPHEWGETCGRA
jgi:hypothetical protein